MRLQITGGKNWKEEKDELMAIMTGSILGKSFKEIGDSLRKIDAIVPLGDRMLEDQQEIDSYTRMFDDFVINPNFDHSICSNQYFVQEILSKKPKDVGINIIGGSQGNANTYIYERVSLSIIFNELWENYNKYGSDGELVIEFEDEYIEFKLTNKIKSNTEGVISTNKGLSIMKISVQQWFGLFEAKEIDSDTFCTSIKFYKFRYPEETT